MKQCDCDGKLGAILHIYIVDQYTPNTPELEGAGLLSDSQE